MIDSTGATYALDGVGCAIADAVGAHVKAGELVSKVVGACGASPAQVERELPADGLVGLV